MSHGQSHNVTQFAHHIWRFIFFKRLMTHLFLDAARLLRDETNLPSPVVFYGGEICSGVSLTNRPLQTLFICQQTDRRNRLLLLLLGEGERFRHQFSSVMEQQQKNEEGNHDDGGGDDEGDDDGESEKRRK